MTYTAAYSQNKSQHLVSRRAVLKGLLASTALPALGKPNQLHAQEATAVGNFGAAAAIVVRTTENITKGNWVWLLNAARDSGIQRIYLLVKQDENNYTSEKTGRVLRSGELLLPVSGEPLADGWENADWINELLARAATYGIEIHAWWPCFQDSVAASKFPHAHYGGEQQDAFVDPAFVEVRNRQMVLLKELLGRYPFNGVALDWIRYSARADGADGPLRMRFEELTGTEWSKEAMADPLLRASWDDLRAHETADWVRELLAELRPIHPTVSWSAFVLPWMFKEVAQSYRHLSEAGLDNLLPMIYWKDWDEKPSFTSDVVSPAPFYLSGRTRLDPTFDITRDAEETRAALEFLPYDQLGHITWYHHKEWTSEDFAKLTAFQQTFQTVRNELYSQQRRDPAHQPLGTRLDSADFPPDASLWSLVCLAELDRRKALENAEPIVPVLGLHRFTEGALESGASVWHTSTAYIDSLLDFINRHDFTVIPPSTVAAYMTSENKNDLPKRPLVLIIDDGSASIAQHFEPRAAKTNIPYSVALVTDWINEDSGMEIDVGNGLNDTILTWQQVKSLHNTGRVSFMSHTHAQHRYANAGKLGTETGPAVTSRLWIESVQRQETEAERIVRVSDDLAQSRFTIEHHTGQKTAFLAWPYGMQDDAVENAARLIGYTHFFQFGGNTIAAPRKNPHRIMRLSVMLQDEVVPLKFPEDPVTQQRWWLAFLRWARASMSIDLMEATLAQLEPAHEEHPESEITRAAQLLLNGHLTLCNRLLAALRNLYPHDATVHNSVDEFEHSYQGLM